MNVHIAIYLYTYIHPFNASFLEELLVIMLKALCLMMGMQRCIRHLLYQNLVEETDKYYVSS